jgi:hypothetical protein
MFNEHMLGVALLGKQFVAKFGGDLAGALLDLGQRGGPVLVGFPAAEEVQVGTVEQEKSGHASWFAPAKTYNGGEFSPRSWRLIPIFGETAVISQKLESVY